MYSTSGLGFDLTYEGLKHYSTPSTTQEQISFDLTYEGLKPSYGSLSSCSAMVLILPMRD